MAKTYCSSCEKKCSGEVLRVQDKFFHIGCFKCSVCGKSLAKGGFFQKDGAYLCTQDYQSRFGTKCAICSKYVEGEVVTMKGQTYHQQCFTCYNCKSPFPSGERVTFVGKNVLCSKCSGLPPDPSDVTTITNSINSGGCSGCGGELKEGQALIALDRQWHVSCFKCTDCTTVLHGEYMGKDGVPYCEKDYQKRFGVKCAYCSRFISGKVLQAGDNHHFHPTCARCTKCGDPFGDGEEMYLQGSAIWHPRCGPGPQSNGVSHTDLDQIDTNSEIQLSLRSQGTSLNGSMYGLKRAGSPGLVLREYKGYPSTDISRIYTYSYLTEEPTYLRKPIEPYDRAPVSPHFHRPAYMGGSMRGRSCKSVSSGGAISSLAESMVTTGGRPRSPHMNNEEPIELAHFPDAHKPKPSDTAPIERDDFPAPPYPYTDPERRRRWSDSYQAIQPDSDEEDETDTSSTLKGEKKVNGRLQSNVGPGPTSDRIHKTKAAPLQNALGSKPGTLSTVLLQGLKERERMMKQRKLDPRNASRSPSASSQPSLRLRYQSPVNASPSRNLDAPKPWDDEDSYDVSSYRSSVGRSNPTLPTYNVYSRSYGRASTLPASISPHMLGDFSYSGMGGMGDKHPSTDFSSAKSDVSGGSICEVDRAAVSTFSFNMNRPDTFRAPYLSPRSMCGGYIRRSLPNMCAVQHAGKVYPYHLLMTSNYRLPPDVDRCNLERHLSEAEFESLFGFARNDFYRLPQWKRNDLKRKLRLF